MFPFRRGGLFQSNVLDWFGVGQIVSINLIANWLRHVMLSWLTYDFYEGDKVRILCYCGYQ